MVRYRTLLKFFEINIGTLGLKIILLPGMDGTGRLFHPFLISLPKNIRVDVISYSECKKQNYSEIIEEIKLRLPKEPFVLLAESFSGRIAYQLSLDPNVQIKKLILVASFLSSPLPVLGRLVSYCPIKTLLAFPIPLWLLRHFCFSASTSEQQLKSFRKTIRSVKPEILAYRLRLILRLKKPHLVSSTDCLVINALNDRLISKAVASDITNYFYRVEKIKIKAPHFLAQTETSQLAEILKAEIEEI